MRRRHVMAVGLVLAVASAPAWGTEPRGPLPRASVQKWGQSDGHVYIGVLGAVGRPGVYEAPERTPSLIDVLNRAGGLAPEATGSIRIIRDGKPGQQVFFTAAARFPLLPGDVVSAVGRTGGPFIRMASATGADGQAADATVRLAFINVLDRPVVLKVRAEDATIERLVELLQQPREAARRVEVVAPSPIPRGPFTPTSTLPNGAALVFDRATIDASKIPPLPPAYGLEHAADAKATADAGIHTEAGAGREPLRSDAGGVAPQDARSSASPGPILTTAAPPESHPSRSVEYLPPAPATNEESVQILPPSSDSRAALRTPSTTETGPGTDRVIVGESEPIDGNSNIPGAPGPSPIVLPKPGRNIASRIPADDDASAKAAMALSTMGKTRQDGEKNSLSAELTSFSGSAVETEAAASNLEIASVWGLFGLVAIVAVWMASRRSRTVAAAPTATAERVKSRLDKLIANELPLDVEAVRLPTRVEFYGKARMKPYFRLDSSHDAEPRKPYIARAGERAATEKSQTAAADAAISEAAASNAAATMAAVPNGRRVDDAHGETRPHAAGGSSGRHPSERKADILERALAAAQESGPRHVGAPHIGMAPSKASDAVAAEGASQS